MVLQFKNYKIELKNKQFLELDFTVKKGEIFSLISDDEQLLEDFKLSLTRSNGFEGEVLINGAQINKNSLLFEDSFGFYPKFSLNKNFRSLLSMFKIKFDEQQFTKQLQLLNLDGEKNYKDLLSNEKIKVKILFLLLSKQKVIVIENYKNKLTTLDKKNIYALIENYKQKDTVVLILDTGLNYFSELAENVLVVSEGKKSYYGSLENLLIIKKLVAINLEYQDDLDILLQNYDYTVLNDSEIVVRESQLENVLYELIRNDIEVKQVRNLGEKIKLYVEETK